MSQRTPPLPSATIEEQEAQTVALLVSVIWIARSVNADRLLYARINWDKLFESASPPGAPIPAVARSSYTRLALREHHQRRAAYRAGISGLTRAILAA